MFYGHTYKENKMKSSLSQAAVMNVEKGEEIVGGWATPHIPQVGLYKLLAKKKNERGDRVGALYSTR
jgi:hypothetical protein